MGYSNSDTICMKLLQNNKMKIMCQETQLKKNSEKRERAAW